MEQNNLLTQANICLIQPSEQYQHEIMDFEEWLKNVQRNEKEGNCRKRKTTVL